MQPSSDPGPPTGSSGGLRSGQLYRQVSAYLTAHPDQEHKVGDITRGINARSAGAVHEACLRMTAAGYTTHTTGPHRFRITPAGIAADGALPPPAPRSTSGGGGRAVKPHAVQRPNGEWYHPRRLAGSTDIEVLRRLRVQHIHVLLYGPPGTGKTALVEAAFPDVITLPGTGDTCVEDLTGSFIPTPAGTFDFVHGPLVTAAQQGRPFFLDDATLIPPKVLAVMYPLMDGRGVLTLTNHRNETITASDGFYVIAGHNPGVHGAVLTEALASRFAVQIEVTTDMDVARSLGTPPKVIAAATALNTQLAAGTIGWAPQLRELIAFTRISKTLGLPAAVANLAAVAPPDDRDDVITALRTQYGTTITPLSLGKQR
jgi:nitric oxide reductase NorQ protein